MAKQSIVDILIVGAGPAGLSAAIQACRRQQRYLVIEAAPSIANTLHNFTQGKWIMSEPLRLPQRSGLDFDAGSREQVLARWQEQIRQYDLQIRYNARLLRIEGEQGRFEVVLEDGHSILCRNVVLGVGVQGNATRLSQDLDPEQLAQYSVKQIPSERKRFLVVGAGDSAVEDALRLAQDHAVVLMNRRQDFERCKAGNRSAIKAAIEQGRIKYLPQSSLDGLKTDPRGIEARYLKNLALDKGQRTNEQQRRRVLVDHVLVRIGASSPRQTLEKMGVPYGESEGHYPQLSEYGESARQGVYVIGALSGQALIKQGMNQGVVCVDHIAGASSLPTELLVLKNTLKQAGLNLNVRDLLAWLGQRAVFKSLAPSALRSAAMDISVQRVGARENLILPGQHGENLSILLDGQLQVETPAGNRYGLARGEIYGELSLLSKQANSCRVYAEKDSVVIHFPYASLQKILRHSYECKAYLHRLFLKRSLKWLLLPNIPDSLLKLMVKQARLIEKARGDLLFAEGSPATHMLVLVQGTVLERNSAGRQSAVEETIRQGGSMLALQEALSGADYRASARVVQDASVYWEIGADVLESMQRFNAGALEQGLKRFDSLVMNPLPHKMGVIDAGKLGFFEANNLGNAGNVLVIDKNKCVGCDQCEVACASAHDGVSRLKRKAGVKLDNLHLPNACRHCKNPECLKDCPADAIQRMASGDVQISDACIACGNCVSNCPYDVITLSEPVEKKSILPSFFNPKKAAPAASKAVKCDLCINRPGGPACVQACPTGAARRVDPAKMIQIANL